MKTLVAILILLSGCEATRQPTAEEQAIIENTRDAQSAGEMILMVRAWREMGMMK